MCVYSIGSVERSIGRSSYYVCIYIHICYCISRRCIVRTDDNSQYQTCIHKIKKNLVSKKKYCLQTYNVGSAEKRIGRLSYYAQISYIASVVRQFHQVKTSRDHRYGFFVRVDSVTIPSSELHVTVTKYYLCEY